MSAWFRVLVIGAQKTGKTTLLSTTVCGDYSSDYNPTSRVESYWDTRHNIEFIDTPGIQDAIINGDGNDGSSSSSASLSSSSSSSLVSAEQTLNRLRKLYDAFTEDAVVKELTEDKGKEAIQLDVDLLSVDAYLILYGDDPLSQRIAKALRMVLFSRRLSSLSGERKMVFFCRNFGHLNRPKSAVPLVKVQRSEADKLLSPASSLEKNDEAIVKYLFSDVPVDFPDLVHPDVPLIAAAHNLPPISAVSGDGVEAMLGDLKDRLAGKSKSRPRAGLRSAYHNKQNGHSKKADDQRFCSINSCVLS